MYSFIKFLKESYNEIVYRMEWPNFYKIEKISYLFIFFTAISCLIIFAIDFFINFIIEHIYEFL